MNRFSKTHLLEWIAVFVIFTSTGLLSAAFQTPIQVNDGKGWDGLHYFKLANKISYFLSEGRSVHNIREPFIYRPGAPFLVALLGRDDIITQFLIVNIIGSLLVAVLMVLWLRRFIHDWRIRILLNGLMITQWYGLLRYNSYYPVLIDPWLMAFTMLGLLLIHRESVRPGWGNVAALTLTTFVGGFFKETFLVVALTLLAVRQPIESFPKTWPFIRLRKPLSIPIRYALPVAGGVAAYIITHVIVSPGQSYSYSDYMYKMLVEKTPLLYILGWFIAFGPVLILCLSDWKNQARFLFSRQYLWVYLLIGAFLAYLGGNETERYLVGVMPVVYVMIGLAIENLKKVLVWPIVALLGAAQAVAQRLFWVIPSEQQVRAPLVWPILTVPGNNVRYFDLFSYYARPEVSLAALGEYLLLTAVVILWLHILRRRQPASDGAAAVWSPTSS